jgi:glycosyltransferase involved in cell wall biosynthesis
MKILMVSEDVPHHAMGGLARHAITLARRLSFAGHKVDFMGNNVVPFEDVRNDIELSGHFFPDLNMKNVGWKETQMGLYNPLRRPFIAWQFARAIIRRAGGYDVVHYHGHFPLLANHIPRDINFVQTRHDQGSDCLAHVRFKNHDVCRETSPFACASCATGRPNVIQRGVSAIAVWMYRKLVAIAFRRHKTIFVSDMLRRNFSRMAGEKDWGKVIHNFVDLSALQRHASTDGVSCDPIEIFIAGKLYEPKGIEAFLQEIYTKLPPNMHISIAGDGLIESSLRRRYGNDQVVLLGWQTYPETMRRMSGANIVVVPSIVEESCATTVLEALALGKATFGLNRGGTPELKVYERYPGQLQLFDRMEDLIAAVIRAKPMTSNKLGTAEPIKADISVLLDSILQIYSADRI